MPVQSELDAHMDWINRHIHHIQIIVGATPLPPGERPTVDFDIDVEDRERELKAVAEKGARTSRPRERPPRHTPSATATRPSELKSSPVKRAASQEKREKQPSKVRFAEPVAATPPATIATVPAPTLVPEGCLAMDLRLSSDEDEGKDGVSIDEEMRIDD